MLLWIKPRNYNKHVIKVDAEGVTQTTLPVFTPLLD